MNISNIIKNARKLSGMKQGILADKIGISQTQLCKIENGKSGVNIKMLVKIADATKSKLLIEFVDDASIYHNNDSIMIIKPVTDDSFHHGDRKKKLKK